MPELSSLIEQLQHDTSLTSMSHGAILDLAKYAARLDPGASLHTFCGDERTRSDLPPELARLFPTEGPQVATLEDLLAEVAVGDHPVNVDDAWERTRDFGGNRFALPSNDKGLRRWLTMLDFTSTFGCVAVILGSEQITSELADLAPRQCRMQTDEASVISDVDDACIAMLGYTREELIGKPSLQLVHEDDHEKAIVSWIQMLDMPGKSLRTKLRYIQANGEIFWAEVTYHNNLAETGKIDREILDVHEQVDAEMAAGNIDRVIRSLADVLPSGIAQVDPELNLVFANDRWREITGLEHPKDKSGYRPLLVEPQLDDVLKEAETMMLDTGIYDREITISPADDTALRRCRLAIRILRDDDDHTTGYVMCLDDITASWRLQQRLVDQATRDQLTGLVNRGAALEHLDRTLADAQTHGHTTAVIFVDLNEFKRVNDVLGHAAGDHLLREVAASISRATRTNDVVARHGGDEFLIICNNVEGRTDAMRIARRLLDSVTGRYRIEGEIIEVGGSCGLTIDQGGSQTAERMIAEADLAMYEQKRSRSHEPRLFQTSMFEEQRDELNRDSALARAVDDDSLVLHYQPVVDLATRQTVGYEALLRWRFGNELVYPDQFIGLAERRGLIPAIGAWVIDEVCREAAASTLTDATWSLNVSPLQLRDRSFDNLIAQALDRHGLRPESLALELTENVVLTDDEATSALLHRLSEMGVKLLIDDFGTGFASLDYLRTFPLHGLKIDRCFTADIERKRTRTIVSMVVNLAEALDVDLVVEGIETAAQAEIIASTGATTGQGYLFGRPAPLTEQRHPVIVSTT